MTSKALVKPIFTDTYLALQGDTDTVNELIAANLGSKGISPLDLDKVVTPTGGGKFWTLPSADGEGEPVKSIEGIMLYWHPQFLYYAHSFDDGGSEPPLCSSIDGMTGVGTPGGDCSKCPMAVFGTDAKGTGPACKRYRSVYLMVPDSYLPLRLQIPVMSVKEFDRYMTRLSASGRHYATVGTSFSLAKAQQKNGSIEYSKVVASKVGDLEPEAVARVREMSAAMQKHIIAALQAQQQTALTRTSGALNG